MSILTNSRLKIGFIGAGNMAQCIGFGLLKAGFPISQLMYSSPSRANHPAIQEKKITCTNQNLHLVQSSDIIILATKPYQIPAALESLKIALTGKCLISVAAGITTQKLSAFTAPDCQIIRAMPNTPALIGKGMTGLFTTHKTNDTFFQFTEAMFSSVGKIIWIDEEDRMDIVTALSGSGPAYLFHLAEALIEAGVSLGLNEHQSHALVLQTIEGAASLLQNEKRTPTELKNAVTSKGGTTEAALNSFNHHHFVEIVKSAVKSASDRGREISQSL